jgi:hypothetical protein
MAAASAASSSPRTLRLRIDSLTCRLVRSQKKEHEPVLHIWLSQDVSHQVHTLALSPSSDTFAPFELQFALHDDNNALQHPIPMIERIQHAYLNVDVFSLLRNKHGQTCRNQSGSVRIPLYELCGGGTSRRDFHLSIPSWGDPNAHGANRDASVHNEKGTISVASAAVLTLEPGAQRVPPLDAHSIAFMREVALKQDSVFQNYMCSTVLFCKNLGYRWKVIQDINA